MTSWMLSQDGDRAVNLDVADRIDVSQTSDQQYALYAVSYRSGALYKTQLAGLYATLPEAQAALSALIAPPTGG